MARKMTLPKIGVNMTEAMITKWLIKVGDPIVAGDTIMEAETDKAVQEIAATESGIVAEILREEGDTVLCHEDILVLIDEEEAYSPGTDTPRAAQPAGRSMDPQSDQPVHPPSSPARVPDPASHAPAPAASPDSAAAMTASAAALPAAPAASTVPIPAAPGRLLAARIRISPLAKKVAAELGIDIRQVQAKIPGQRIAKSDILAHHGRSGFTVPTVSPVETAQQADVIIPMSPTRRVIAARMLDSSQNRPMVPLTLAVNAGAMLALRRLYKQRNVKISIDAFLAYAAASLLPKHKSLNAILKEDAIVQKQTVNIGIAIDTSAGLVVPVIKNASTKKLAQLAGELAEKTQLAQAGKLSIDDMSGGTFTITNLGMFGIEEFVPIINPPECCILAAGAIKQVFVPDLNGQPQLEEQMKLTLVFDHRLVDGAPAARFLMELKSVLEMPELLL